MGTDAQKTVTFSESDQVKVITPIEDKQPIAFQSSTDNDDNIVFQQENPKRAGTLCWARYEAYKAAKTRNEARQLGASSRDLNNDQEKGYLTTQGVMSSEVVAASEAC